MADTKPKVLFVCTGNIFRSLTAELALKKHLGSDCGIEISSAGTGARDQPIRDYVLSEFKRHGLEAGGHTPRKLTAQMLEQSSIVIPMAQSHKEALKQDFGFESPMFNEVCYRLDESVPDIDDKPFPTRNREEEALHARLVVSYIIDSMPVLSQQIERLLLPKLALARELIPDRASERVRAIEV